MSFCDLNAAGISRSQGSGRRESLAAGEKLNLNIYLLGALRAWDPVPTAPSRAGMFKLGACHDEFPQIFLLTCPYGISHLVRQQSSDKLQFAAISPFLTPPFHSELLGAGMRGCTPKEPWLVPLPLWG